MQRSHLDMILRSNITRNEDRFNAILPSWDKYKHTIRNKNTVSRWEITGTTSVRLKLYEIMDIWYRARFLIACSIQDNHKIMLPTFASHDINSLKMVVKDNIQDTYEIYEIILIDYHYDNREGKEHIKQLIKKYKMMAKPIWTDNLTSIQLDHHCLSVKSNIYFSMDIDEYYKKRILVKNPSLVEHGISPTHILYISFFTFTIPDYTDYSPNYGTGIELIGNMDKNRWAIFPHGFKYFKSKEKSSIDYTFNIY